jgi:hypothetical protein
MSVFFDSRIKNIENTAISTTKQGLKVTKSGIIGGLVLTGYMLYKAREEARKSEAWSPYLLAIPAIAPTFACGFAAGVILQTIPSVTVAKFAVKSSFAATKFTVQLGPKALVQGIKTAYSLISWLGKR